MNEPMSTQHRASADCARLAIGRLSSASAESLQQQTKKKKILWQNASSRIETLSRDCTLHGNSAKNRTSECVEQCEQKPTMRGG
jgi:hypothetical protein